MNLIFFCPVKKSPVGGIKVIYRLSEVISTILPEGSKSLVLHPNRPFFRPSWFKSGIQFRRMIFGLNFSGKLSFSNIKNIFDPENDIVVLPETWVHKYASQLHKFDIRFVIFVQNGYLMSKGNREEISAGYRNAVTILTVSDDCTKCVQQAFNINIEKISRVNLFVDPKKFISAPRKEKIITYMPRKLGGHFEILRFFIGDRISSDWRFFPIDGCSEDKVADSLSKSQIFLSLSNREGLGLPPIEAAMAGNYVIGYTGEGGKEFWEAPLFSEIHHGDFLAFAEAVIFLTQKIENSEAPDISSHRSRLIKKFSEESQMQDVLALMRKLDLVSSKVQDVSDIK
jgi:glycosyltransferase involved in cell wall biosynthesis